MEKLRDSNESGRREGAPVSETAWRLTVIAAEFVLFQNLAIPDARLQGDAANNHISQGTAGASCGAWWLARSDAADTEPEGEGSFWLVLGAVAAGSGLIAAVFPQPLQTNTTFIYPLGLCAFKWVPTPSCGAVISFQTRQVTDMFDHLRAANFSDSRLWKCICNSGQGQTKAMPCFTNKGLWWMWVTAIGARLDQIRHFSKLKRGLNRYIGILVRSPELVSRYYQYKKAHKCLCRKDSAHGCTSKYNTLSDITDITKIIGKRQLIKS